MDVFLWSQFAVVVLKGNGWQELRGEHLQGAQDEILIATGGWKARRKWKGFLGGVFGPARTRAQFRRTAERGERENIGALDGCRVSHFVSEGADVSPSPWLPFYTRDESQQMGGDLTKQQHQRKERERALLSPPHALLIAFRWIEKYSYLLALKRSWMAKERQS